MLALIAAAHNCSINILLISLLCAIHCTAAMLAARNFPVCLPPPPPLHNPLISYPSSSVFLPRSFFFGALIWLENTSWFSLARIRDASVTGAMFSSNSPLKYTFRPLIVKMEHLPLWFKRIHSLHIMLMLIHAKVRTGENAIIFKTLNLSNKLKINEIINYNLDVFEFLKNHKYEKIYTLNVKCFYRHE